MRAIATGVVVGALVAGAMAQPAPDFEHAKDLYKSGEEAMKTGRYQDAVRDYGGAYEITRDPVLFFKIGNANEKAGKCELALIYYGRYLREARPSESFAASTKEKIRACGGDPNSAGSGAGAGSAAVVTPPVVTPPVGSGTGPGSDAGSGSATPVPPVGTGSGSATVGDGSGTSAIDPGSGSGSVKVVHHSNKAAWVLTATSIAFVTVGAVLAYSASSSENDISDLYVGIGGQPPRWDMRTQQQYEDLVDEGNRYEKLSWVSFGLAGATGIAAAVLFWRGSGEASVQVAPTASATGGGVSVLGRF
ncbi:MAG: hypothetical protein H0T46_18195 [Deltaproteobacteria bacterium]|nr:hypothetical protein [Deltaproteobacteria bacterium]